MYRTEEAIMKAISAPDGSDEFRMRYIRNESVGVITTRAENTYFLLDSKEYWYDLIQEKYPPVMKCACKNDFFRLTFRYIPRAGTEDFRGVEITCRCTACQKEKKLPPVEIDYSPSAHLLEQPIAPCKVPNLKYKTHLLQGYWSKEELLGLSLYLREKTAFVYCWYWDSDRKRKVKTLADEELQTFLSGFGGRYIDIYFSMEPLEEDVEENTFDNKGARIPCGIWRKKQVFLLHGPITVIGRGQFYHMEFCGEYLDSEGNIVEKPEPFRKLVEDFRKYSKGLLKK